MVDSIEALSAALEAHLAGEGDGSAGFAGRVESELDGIPSLGHDDDMREAIGKWIARGKLGKLADLWVKGLEIDWDALYPAARPGLMSLPTYPFAKERYWLSLPARSATAIAGATGAHPLLQANLSDFYRQRYASTFDGHEWFLSDHRVGPGGTSPRRLLPGEIGEKLAQAIPIRKLGRIEDIASLALFLLSDAARNINGETVVSDGGQSLCGTFLSPEDFQRMKNQMR